MTPTETKLQNSPNPLTYLDYEPALESLGDDYYDEVRAAEFPQHILRWRNDDLLPQLGLDPKEVSDEHFIAAFGKFQGVRPFLALRYHGYQFGTYNSLLGDGRGFLYGQVRGIDGELYDLGTKGSGRTPYSRGADGRLTLKGGVREVLAGEALHRLGVRTSRCLSMVETGQELWRGDEPSPTRSCVMVRFSRSHIRFGTFERLRYFERTDLIKQLLDHVIDIYYPPHPPLVTQEREADRYLRFYEELVQRVAALGAQWMAAGFCHGVLNTDNMSITGESFDYGPYAFIPHYDPKFIAAYFDYEGRYSYGNQPLICKWNLELLQGALLKVIPAVEMDKILDRFDEYYQSTYRELMMKRLGLESVAGEAVDELLQLTIEVLKDTQIGYQQFFMALSEEFKPSWRDDAELIPNFASAIPWEKWRRLYQGVLQSLPAAQMDNVASRLEKYNPKTVLLRPAIESVWSEIVEFDDWQPFYQLVRDIKE